MKVLHVITGTMAQADPLDPLVDLGLRDLDPLFLEDLLERPEMQRLAVDEHPVEARALTKLEQGGSERLAVVPDVHRAPTGVEGGER